MSSARQIYDEYLESINHEFRTEDMVEMDYKDELELIEFVLKRSQKTGVKK